MHDPADANCVRLKLVNREEAMQSSHGIYTLHRHPARQGEREFALWLVQEDLITKRVEATCQDHCWSLLGFSEHATSG